MSGGYGWVWVVWVGMDVYGWAWVEMGGHGLARVSVGGCEWVWVLFRGACAVRRPQAHLHRLPLGPLAATRPSCWASTRPTPWRC